MEDLNNFTFIQTGQIEQTMTNKQLTMTVKSKREVEFELLLIEDLKRRSLLTTAKHRL